MKLIKESLDDLFLPKKEMLDKWKRDAISGVAKMISDEFNHETSYVDNDFNPVILIKKTNLDFATLKNFIEENTSFYVNDIGYSLNPLTTFVYLRKFYETV